METALRHSMTFSAAGQSTQVTTYGYNELNHLTLANTDSPVKERSWVYDANGNRKTQNIAGLVTSYDYDAGNRLKTR
ncbi:MAG: hypothetical protein HYY29_03315, partial [Chloroflexi bacterium]|nr:hypothetical protein [Chloroflexota bacterium]